MTNISISQNPIIYIVISMLFMVLILVVASNMGRDYSFLEELDDTKDDKRDLDIITITALNLLCICCIVAIAETTAIISKKNTDEILKAFALSAIFCILWSVLFYHIGRKYSKKEQKEIQRADT